MPAAFTAHRRGITILEVLFSIGIILIGILGISVVINIAGLRAQQGLQARRSSVMAGQGLAEFDTRGWKRPDSIIVSSGSTHATLAQVVANPVAYAAIFRNQIPAFCVDPYFIARNMSGAAVPALAGRFPYTNVDPGNASDRMEPVLITPPGFSPIVDPSMPTANPLSMPRVSVRAAPGVAPFPMSVKIAERLMTEQNDLALDLPKDRTVGPIQKFGDDNARRQTDGHYSWMATVSPRFNRNRVIPEQYRLSVVVMRDRVPNLTIGGQVNPTSERLVLSAQFVGNGMNGGTLQMVTRNAFRPQDDLSLRRGQWVLLSGAFRDSATTFTPIHAWYQIRSYDRDIKRTTIGGVQVWSRWVTLNGPDWPVFHPTANPTGIFAQDVRITIVETVDAVREETFQLEGPSYWD